MKSAEEIRRALALLNQAYKESESEIGDWENSVMLLRYIDALNWAIGEENSESVFGPMIRSMETTSPLESRS